MIRLFNQDCMTAMASMPDKAYDLDWYEIDKDYFTAAKERLERHQQQEVLDL